MTIKTKPEEVWAEYEKGKAYNNSLNLYEQIEQNENFYIGKQWEGVNAPDLDKPVLNVLKRVTTYMISTLVTDNVGIAITPQEDSEAGKKQAEILEKEVDKVVEYNKVISTNRKLLRNACVQGKSYYYNTFDPDKRAVVTELLECTRVLYGNPFVNDIQKQPFIIIVQQMLLDNVKAMAPASERDSIKADVDEPWNQDKQTYGADRTTVLVKMWKENGTVRFIKTTKEVQLKAPTDTGYRSYPLAAMTWEEKRDSYQGQAAITGLIPNQIAINKLWAMAIRYQTMHAFSKVIYDRTKIKEWNNDIGVAIGVNGNPNDAIASAFRTPDMSNQVLAVVDSTINYTKELMGASDAALGNVRPDNTSAIIAVQKAAAAPLELQRLAFYQCIEDYVRSVLELICVHYGVRSVKIEITDPNTGAEVMTQVPFDFGAVNIDQLEWRVDVGASAYWSELTQIQTLDNLVSSGILTDAVLYLESIPDEYIKNKQSIIESVRRKQQEQEMLQQQQMIMQMGGVPIG